MCRASVLRVASVGGAESIILSVGSVESMMHSACAESMDTLSTARLEDDTLSAVWSCYYTTLTAAAIKTKPIGNYDDH
jgi:hypothetical protein